MLHTLHTKHYEKIRSKLVIEPHYKMLLQSKSWVYAFVFNKLQWKELFDFKNFFRNKKPISVNKLYMFIYKVEP